MFSGFCKQKILEISQNLALGELRCATGGFETVLLSFLHTWVTSEEACLLECRTERFVILEKSSGKTVADSACLTGYTATVYTAYDVELFCSVCESERLTNDELECVKTKVIVNISIVDCDFTCTCIYTYTSNRLLASACSIEIRI